MFCGRVVVPAGMLRCGKVLVVGIVDWVLIVDVYPLERFDEIIWMRNWMSSIVGDDLTMWIRRHVVLLLLMVLCVALWALSMAWMVSRLHCVVVYGRVCTINSLRLYSSSGIISKS
jgi:hypothetical protein